MKFYQVTQKQLNGAFEFYIIQVAQYLCKLEGNEYQAKFSRKRKEATAKRKFEKILQLADDDFKNQLRLSQDGKDENEFVKIHFHLREQRKYKAHDDFQRDLQIAEEDETTELKKLQQEFKNGKLRALQGRNSLEEMICANFNDLIQKRVEFFQKHFRQLTRSAYFSCI